jgi:dethiobiotin synthetase
MGTIFITGTDTGVGKTHVAACLAAYLSVKKHLNVGVMKPFESGLSKRDKDDLPWDAICLKEASGSADGLDMISPYTFEAPLAPEVAAMIERVTIDLEVLDKIYCNISQSHDMTVVEGAGGVLVPILRDFFYINLIRRWSTPVIVVSRLGLGTINHTLLTCNYLLSQGVHVIGVILNNTEGLSDLAANTNPEVLKVYLTVPVLGIFPHNKGLLQGNFDRALLADAFERSIDLETLFKRLTPPGKP